MARAAGRADVDVERLSNEFFSVTARSSRMPPKDRWGESDDVHE